MVKVISEFGVEEYKVLKLDGEKPKQNYTKYRINGKVFEIVPLYDMKNCIAVKSSESFIGNEVEFI